MSSQQETSAPVESDSQRIYAIQQNAKTATDWLRIRNFTLPPADAQDIVAAREFSSEEWGTHSLAAIEARAPDPFRRRAGGCRRRPSP